MEMIPPFIAFRITLIQLRKQFLNSSGFNNVKTRRQVYDDGIPFGNSKNIASQII
jgi:hypothetical protein